MIKMNFKRKLSMVMILLILIPVILCITIFVTKGSIDVRNAQEERNIEITKSISKNLDIMLKDMESVMDAMANTKAITDMNPEKMNDTLKQVVNTYHIFSNIFVMNPKGDQIYKVEGNLVSSVSKSYFQGAIKGQDTYSNVKINSRTKKAIVLYAIPVKKDNKIVGVLGATINLDTLSNLVSEENGEKHINTFIIDASGKIIAHKNKKLVENMQDISALSIVQKVIKGETGTGEYTYEGEQLSETSSSNLDKKANDIESVNVFNKGQTLMVAWTRFSNTDWGIITTIPKKEVFSKIYVQILFGLMILIGSVGIGLFVAVIIARGVTKPLINLSNKMGLAANGDMSVAVEGRILDRQDEFGILARGFNFMVSTIEKMVGKMRGLINEITVSSMNLSEIVTQNSAAMEEVASAINSLAYTSVENAQTTSDGRGFIEEMLGNSERITQNIKDLIKVSSNTVKVAEQGANMMNYTSNAINEASKSAIDIDENMNKLNIDTDKIGGFIESILSIASQSNLLALNAAIEAARAGESGKGFAVVANEMRTLAIESGDSANQIISIIETIQNEVEKTSNMANDMNKKLQEGVDKTQLTEEKINNILSDVQITMKSVEEISVITEKQSDFSEQLAIMMKSLAESTENTSSTAEEISATTEEQTSSLNQIANRAQALSKIAQDIQDIINQFK